jgi:hypothetical protein
VLIVVLTSGAFWVLVTKSFLVTVVLSGDQVLTADL